MLQRRVGAIGILFAVLLAACDTTATIRSSDPSATGPGKGDTAQGETRLPEIDLEQEDADIAGTTVTQVVEETLPSVVNVRVQNLDENPFTGEFEEGRGQGSGVIIDDNGIIITNNHVIEGALEVNVVFTDDRDPLEGQVIGAIPENDLAVIRVEADDLDAIELGRSDSLDLGESVVAIGFPLGLGGPTVTQGIISGLERTIQVDDRGETKSLEGLLQTDAAINPGNSGGALVDMQGRLVGVNTAAVQASSAENIGFAIAIDEAVPVIEEILEDPPEEQAWLGVSLGSIDSPSAAAQFELDPDRRGALVMGVVPGSPAEEAGLVEGDLIVGIADADVGSGDDVTEVLRERAPGETVEIEYLRLGASATDTLELTLGARPAVFEQRG